MSLLGRLFGTEAKFAFSRRKYVDPDTLWNLAQLTRLEFDGAWLKRHGPIHDLPSHRVDELLKKADAFNTSANTLSQRGHGDAAIKAYERAICAFPRSPVAYHNLCVESFKRQDQALIVLTALTAILLCSEATIGDYEGYKLFTWLGDGIRELEGDRSSTALQRLCELQPDSPGLQWCLGTDLFLRKEYERAILQFEATIQIRRDFFLAHYDIGRCHLNLQDWADALAAFKVALSVRPADTVGFQLGLQAEKWIAEHSSKVRPAT